MDLENIEAIMNCLIPKNVIDVRSFMSLVGYYKRFIDVFSKSAYPITYFEKKGIKFICCQDCEESF